jgi:16S rRNA (guanine527-N7)-methyltransferase
MTRLAIYYELLNEWNSRLHLVAPCSAKEFARRHLLESLFAVSFLPAGATIIDVGSGAGLPIIPCLIARPDLRATLIESSAKKSVFLREALKRTFVAESTSVVAKRFQDVTDVHAQVVTCRALDRFEESLPDLIEWSRSSTLFLFGGVSLREKLGELGVGLRAHLLPGSQQRFLIIAEHP